MASCVVVSVAAMGPAHALGGLPVRGLREGSQPIAVLGDGVVWVDEDKVVFQGFRSGAATLGGLPQSRTPILEGSGNAVVLVGAGAGFSAGIPPRRLAPVEGADEEVRAFVGGGCSHWSPLVSSLDAPEDFAVADGELVDAGECPIENGGFDEQELATAQPLFVHNLRGGEWHVLRWLKGHEPPILAADGNLLAIGEPLSTETVRVTGPERMRVTILELPTRNVVSRFVAPLGHLSFASKRRLVVLVLVGARAAAAPPPSKQPEVTIRLRSSYRLDLYGLDGRPLAYIGTVREPVLISHMHMLVEEEVEGHTVLAVRNMLDGSTRRLIGFNEPARTLEAVAFRWPAVALIETTSVPLAQSEVTCGSGEYHPASPPRLRIFDLARRETYMPPPPSAHLSHPAGCPPRSDTPPF